MIFEKRTKQAMLAVFLLGFIITGAIYRHIGLIPIGYGVSLDELVGLTIIVVGWFWVWDIQRQYPNVGESNG